MTVKLISITKPVDAEISAFSPEELTAYVARVSNPSNQMSSETAPKLLKYCIAHNHWSVFEHVSFTVEIKTSRAIAAQILRHRSFVFQEFSQRYAEATDYLVYEARRQDKKNRQNSIDDLPEETKEWFHEAQVDVMRMADELYKEGLAKGIAKEQMRFLLPLSTETTLYMTGNLRSWITYINLRKQPETQLEHREIALEVQEIFKKEFPHISEALEWG